MHRRVNRILDTAVNTTGWISKKIFLGRCNALYLFSTMFISFWLSAALRSTGQPLPGAYRLQAYLPLLQGKNISVVVNHTSMVGRSHLVDTLLYHGIRIQNIMAPEHGFRGTADAGAAVLNSTDAKTGLPIVSLYGKNKKPTREMLQKTDLILFDIQDVGTRFYTYLSTMHYVLEAAAELEIPVVLLDRPNPNGMYVAGPVLDTVYRSFVGLHPIPILHGCTLGELAQMIVGEKWLHTPAIPQLTVIPCTQYTHKSRYILPIKPSPNLPNEQSIALYASLCLFEGTIISVGRGTTYPFQVYGHTFPGMGVFTFIPKSIEGMAVEPPYKNQVVYGVDLRNVPFEGGFSLRFLIDAYKKCDAAHKAVFFNSFFKKLAGNEWVQNMIQNNMPEDVIARKWENDLEKFKTIRKKYLLYPE